MVSNSCDLTAESNAGHAYTKRFGIDRQTAHGQRPGITYRTLELLASSPTSHLTSAAAVITVSNSLYSTVAAQLIDGIARDHYAAAKGIFPACCDIGWSFD